MLQKRPAAEAQERLELSHATGKPRRWNHGNDARIMRQTSSGKRIVYFFPVHPQSLFLTRCTNISNLMFESDPYNVRTMQYANLGRTGLKVSRLCLGTMNYGPEATEAEGFAQMDKALELGINFFDTADVYGWKKGEGVTEQIVGKWFAKGGMRREKVILATKVYGDMNADPTDLTMARGLNAVKIRRACEGSLKRLKTDYIDLYQMHHIN